MQAHEMRAVFLGEFVKQIIIHTKPRVIELEIEEKIESPARASQKLQAEAVQYIPSLAPVPAPAYMPQQYYPSIPAPQAPARLPARRFPFIPRRPAPAQAAPEQTMIPALISGYLNKLSNYLVDPSVSSIECPGPGKPIIVNKAGLVQSTSIVMNSEEISNALKDVSQRTRIPLITGVFKAAFDNFIITAVISEYVGSRFIIQRRPQVLEFPIMGVKR